MIGVGKGCEGSIPALLVFKFNFFFIHVLLLHDISMTVMGPCVCNMCAMTD